MAFCRERELYGEPLAKLPTVAQRLGDMQSRLMTARLAAYHAVHLLDRHLPCDAELMNAKLLNTESALTSARAALEIFAGRAGRYRAVSSTVSGVPSSALRARSTEHETQVKVGVSRLV